MGEPATARTLGPKAGPAQLPVAIRFTILDSNVSVRFTMEEIRAEVGKVNMPVNNAGRERCESVQEIWPENYREVMETEAAR